MNTRELDRFAGQVELVYNQLTLLANMPWSEYKSTLPAGLLDPLTRACAEVKVVVDLVQFNSIDSDIDHR